MITPIVNQHTRQGSGCIPRKAGRLIECQVSHDLILQIVGVEDVLHRDENRGHSTRQNDFTGQT